MKRAFIALVTGLLALESLAAAPPSPGLYRCQQGNEESICDQDLRILRAPDGQLRRARVEYVGWCGSMGPYVYSCDSTGCSDGFSEGIRIEFIDSKSYRWENRQYGFVCDRMIRVRTK